MINMRVFFISLLMAACVSVTAQSRLSAAETKAFVSRITSESKNIKTLQADFIQTKKMDFLSKDLISSGKIAMQTPNLLSWRYSKPYLYNVVFKNNKIYIDNQGKKSAVDAKSKYFEKINKLIVGSATGNLFNDPEFNVSYLKSGGYTIARFVPKSAQLSKYIKTVELYFAKDQSTVSKVNLTEASGDSSQIVFKNTQVNAKLPAAAFSL